MRTLMVTSEMERLSDVSITDKSKSRDRDA